MNLHTGRSDLCYHKAICMNIKRGETFEKMFFIVVAYKKKICETLGRFLRAYFAEDA